MLPNKILQCQFIQQVMLTGRKEISQWRFELLELADRLDNRFKVSYDFQTKTYTIEYSA